MRNAAALLGDSIRGLCHSVGVDRRLTGQIERPGELLH
jgi:hypothetical protein